jgi:hypothetical protein
MSHSFPARLPLSKHASQFPTKARTVKACLTVSQQGSHCQSMPHSFPARLSQFPSKAPNVKACLRGSQQDSHCQSMPHSFPARLPLSKHASQFPSKAPAIQACLTVSLFFHCFSLPSTIPACLTLLILACQSPRLPLNIKNVFHGLKRTHIILCFLDSSVLPIIPLSFKGTVS